MATFIRAIDAAWGAFRRCQTIRATDYLGVHTLLVQKRRQLFGIGSVPVRHLMPSVQHLPVAIPAPPLSPKMRLQMASKIQLVRDPTGRRVARRKRDCRPGLRCLLAGTSRLGVIHRRAIVGNTKWPGKAWPVVTDPVTARSTSNGSS
jgi:hypothetical protein